MSVPIYKPFRCPKCKGTDVVATIPVKGAWCAWVRGVNKHGQLVLEGIQKDAETYTQSYDLYCDNPECKHEWRSRRPWSTW